MHLSQSVQLIDVCLGDETYSTHSPGAARAKRMMASLTGVTVTLLGTLSVVAQGSTATTQSPTASASVQASASVYPGSATYSYLGCYNETTGNPDLGNVRALAGGNMTASNSMTVEQCMAFCGSNKYAGLEYGRECWCSDTLNSFAQKLPDLNCSLTCSGDKTEVCGGFLALTTYQRKADAKSHGYRLTHWSSVMLLLFCCFGVYAVV